MWPTILLTCYCAAVAAASLAGGWLPSVLRLTHTRMQIVMSFVAGFMLGVSILHLLPHAVLYTESLDVAAWSTLVGLLTMFFMIRIFHVHQHSVAESPECHGDHAHASGDDEPGHAHVHEHHAGGNVGVHHHQEPTGRLYGLSWVGLFVGLGLHTVIDGVALGASVPAESHGEIEWLGIGTFLAIFLHKPLDALSVTSMMLAGDWSVRWRATVNLIFALLCPAAALAFHFGVQGFAESDVVVGIALAFAAGVFLCIALADVLPEVQFHAHDRVALSVALLTGVILALLIGLAEPEHAHEIH